LQFQFHNDLSFDVFAAYLFCSTRRNLRVRLRSMCSATLFSLAGLADLPYNWTARLRRTADSALSGALLTLFLSFVFIIRF